jgi:hypothetical protein
LLGFLSVNVTADYACANKEFSYFCPHSVCLQEVRPKRIVNAHFFAPEMHVAGCPNEPEKVEGDGTALKPAKKPSIVGAPSVPTELGPAKSLKTKRSKPTKSELFALANALKGSAPSFAGTLKDVVDAWLRMPSEQRAEKPLLINDENFSYESGFYCLSSFGETPVEELPCTSKVIYGMARVKNDRTCYWITSVKAFCSADNKVNLVINVPKDGGLTANYLNNLFETDEGAKSFTLFYFGDVPKLSASGKSYGISKDISDDYRRFVLAPA